MFGKKDQGNKIEAFLGPETEVKGDITTKGTLRIDGLWTGGTVTADGVVIGENGSAIGNINAKEIIVGGKVEGNLTANMNLELHNQARVKGDIRTPKLSISEGALFEGNCTMTQEQLSFESETSPAANNKPSKKGAKSYDTQLSEG